ncbi:Zn-ribbon domain-containing protein [Methanolapillus millepedarum]|uniref:Zn-ribbon containing protein n=1 Tax=Methanolapillus millepedarum TaxID=3028296 RepID=A0AA96VFP4_9EURY|nr:hypothetical protein MsAc7_13010 [Methanosarcinaceae archaeon Ac7]
MPHRCTKCGAIFSDGDPVILTGCPTCKWNKFLYVREETVAATAGNVHVDAGLETDLHEIEKTKWPDQNEKSESINKVLENIDSVLDSEEMTKQEPEPGRVDSIRILDTGSYELNLGSIMDKEEIVVGIKEEGQYAIDLPVILQQSAKKGKAKKK